MRLINQTRGTVLAENIIFANTPAKRLKGLLGYKNFLNSQALIIKPCNCVHTLFMRFAIDVLLPLSRSASKKHRSSQPSAILLRHL